MKPAVLVVEDDESNRQLLELYLERHGFDVVGVGDGESALKAADARRFDLAILDVMMPGMNGFELLAALRKRFSEADLPIVMATAVTDSQEIVEALRLGANDYVTKPYDLRVLVARVQARLRIDHRSDVKKRGPTPAEIGHGAVIAERYRIEQRIGRGANGDVFSARHVELDNPVAVKVLRLPEDSERRITVLERFRREGISACRVKHPNAVTVLDAGVTLEGVAYLVMERLEGRALDEEIDKNAPFLPARCAQLLVPVCYVLAEAHGAGVIHRDVKPANIFVHAGKRGEVVKVLDFGIAKMIDADGDANATERIVGTPAYMAPERIRNAPHDGRADIYSLGVVLFEMLAGRRPFVAHRDDPITVARMHLKDPPPSLWDVRNDVSRDLVNLVADALAKDPAQRPTPEMFAVRLSDAVTTARAS